MDLDITLDQLPEHILEEIFGLTSNLADLRLVCKTFKRVIDNSTKLLKDKWLSVDKTLTLNSADIHYPYQNLVLHSLGALELYWMSKYQHKNRIKAIRITSGDRCPTILQYILNNFDSLEVLDFDLDRFYDENFFNPSNVRLVPNVKSKLQTLRFGYYQIKQHNILELFADISSIKTLYINDFDILKFPQNVQWKLDKLMLPDRSKDELSVEIDNYSCKKFLLSQQTTLKELRFYDQSDYSSYIMRTLPNLEYLSLCLQEDSGEFNDINDEILISNLKLKHLDLIDTCPEELPLLETLLKHYKNIKHFCFTSNYSFIEKITYKPLEEIELFNITQMFLQSEICMLVLKANLPNLKILTLCDISDEGLFDLTEIPNENLKNLEKLSFEACNEEDAVIIIQKSPKLFHLNISQSCNDYSTYVTYIKNILVIAPQVMKLGLIEQKIEDDELHRQIENDSLIIMMHDDFRSMIAEDWGREFADSLFLDSENW